MDKQYTPEDIQKRFRDLHRDRDLLQSGWIPKEKDLENAPVIGNWVAILRGGEPALVGVVTNHPRLRGMRRIVTSPLVAIDAGWARTEGRFYRLGPQYLPQPPADESAQTFKF